MGWLLTSSDLFDRESPAVEEARGDCLANGLAALWEMHLREGFCDDGQRSFTSFGLSWDGLGVPDGSAYVDYYSQHHAAGAPKLRRWLLTGDARSLLAAIVGAHSRLIEKGKRNPVDVILAAAASAPDAKAFESIAARIG